METLYRINLPDAFTPAFCSFDKPYYGTQGAVQALLTRTNCPATPITSVQVVATRQSSIQGLTCTFANLWGDKHYMTAPEARATIYYIHDNGTYCRCIMAAMRGLTYVCERLPHITQTLDAGECWGPPIFAQDGAWMVAHLAYREQIFANEAEMHQDMATPAPIDFDGFWQDIFADG